MPGPMAPLRWRKMISPSKATARTIRARPPTAARRRDAPRSGPRRARSAPSGERGGSANTGLLVPDWVAERPKLSRQSVYVKSNMSLRLVTAYIFASVPKLWTETIKAHRREVREAILDTTARWWPSMGCWA